MRTCWSAVVALSICGLAVGCEQSTGDTGTGGGGTQSGGAGAGAGGSSAGGSSAGGSSAGGSSAGGSSAGGAGGAGELELPTPDTRFDYQLGGAYDPPSGVQMVIRDRTASPAPSVYNVCYVNGFQAQQSEDAFWLNEHPTLVLRDNGGQPVIDQDWDEMLLDTSTAEKRTALTEIVGGWIAGCGSDGYKAVEIDNLDSYSRSGGRLSEQNAVDFMALLSQRAHSAGIAIAQKNSAELVNRRAEMGTDFAVVEECNRYSECQDFVDAYGNSVFIIEYRQQDFSSGCSDFPNLSIVFRDLDLVAPGAGGYVFDDC